MIARRDRGPRFFNCQNYSGLTLCLPVLCHCFTTVLGR
jgi:hypothetical protein